MVTRLFNINVKQRHYHRLERRQRQVRQQQRFHRVKSNKPAKNVMIYSVNVYVSKQHGLFKRKFNGVKLSPNIFNVLANIFPIVRLLKLKMMSNNYRISWNILWNKLISIVTVVSTVVIMLSQMFVVDRVHENITVVKHSIHHRQIYMRISFS